MFSLENDLENVLNEFGVSMEAARLTSENLEDRICMPVGNYKFYIDKSNIEGLGVFSLDYIAINEIIGKTRWNEKRTPLGRFTNHSKDANSKMKFDGRDINLIAIKNINKGKEITVNYKQVAIDIHGL